MSATSPATLHIKRGPMGEKLTITVRSDSGIITARMRVRELARSSGFGILDQARISLATSSSAYVLGLGKVGEDRIVMDCFRDGERVGLRVCCIKTEASAEGISPGDFGDTRWMVDDLRVEAHPAGGVQVVLVKWKE